MLIEGRLSPNWMIISLVVVFAFILGCAIAIIPVGGVARLFLPILLACSLFVAWGFRSERKSKISTILWVLVLATITLSVIWPRYIFFYPAGLPGINPYTLLILSSIYIGTFGLVYSRPLWIEFSNLCSSWKSMTWLISAYLGWGFICSVAGSQPLYSSIEFIKECIYLSSFLFFGLLLATYDKGPLYVVRILVICGFFVSLIGVIESFTYKNLFTPFASMEGSKSSLNALQGIISSKSRDGMYRVQSVFGHPIVFAQFLAAIFPLSFFLMSRDKAKIFRIIAFAFLPLAILAIVKSGSRSGYFSLAAAVFSLVFIRWFFMLKHGAVSRVVAIVFLPAAAAVTISCYFLLGALFAGRNQHEISSTNTRINMFVDGIRALGESPIWGFGHGMAWEKAGVVGTDGIATIDSYLLNLVLDYGIVGLGIFCVILLVFSIKCIKISIESASDEGAFLGACCASLLAMFVTYGGLSTNQNLTYFWLILTIAYPYVYSARRFH